MAHRFLNLPENFKRAEIRATPNDNKGWLVLIDKGHVTIIRTVMLKSKDYSQRIWNVSVDDNFRIFWGEDGWLASFPSMISKKDFHTYQEEIDKLNDAVWDVDT